MRPVGLTTEARRHGEDAEFGRGKVGRVAYGGTDAGKGRGVWEGRALSGWEFWGGWSSVSVLSAVFCAGSVGAQSLPPGCRGTAGRKILTITSPYALVVRVAREGVFRAA